MINNFFSCIHLQFAFYLRYFCRNKLCRMLGNVAVTYLLLEILSSHSLLHRLNFCKRIASTSLLSCWSFYFCNFQIKHLFWLELGLPLKYFNRLNTNHPLLILVYDVRIHLRISSVHVRIIFPWSCQKLRDTFLHYSRQLIFVLRIFT